MAMSNEQKAEHSARIKAGKVKAKAEREAKALRASTVELAVTMPHMLNEIPVRASGGTDEDEARNGVSEPDPAFTLFLASIDAETRSLLSDDQLVDIFTAKRAQARAEKVALAKKRLEENALHAARVGEGLLPAAAQDEVARLKRMNELVTFTPDVAPSSDGTRPDEGLRINGRLFRYGVPVTVTRGEYDSMRDILYRCGTAELLFEGRGASQRQWLMGMAQGTVNRNIEHPQ